MFDSDHWMLDHLPIGIWVASAADCRPVYANSAFNEIVGVNVPGGSDIQELPKPYRLCDREGRPYPADRLPLRQAIATGKRVMVDDMVIHRADGRQVSVRAFASPVGFGDDGRVSHVIVAFLDITAELQALAERAAVEARLKMVVDHTPVAFFCIDRDGVITLSEGAGLQSLGVRSGELVGQSVFDLYREHPTIPGFFRRVLAGEAFSYSATVGDLVFDSWLTPLRNDAGEVVGAAGVANDVSEIRSLQAAAIQSDRVMAMGTLAASVAHEINNPLTYILTGLHQLEHGLAAHQAALQADPDAAERALEVRTLAEILEPVRKGVERIAAITRDLRTFSRPDDARRDAIDVAAVIESVVALLRKEVETRGRLTVSLAPGLQVMASEARLAQVVTNLMMNALHALPAAAGAEHQIEVSTRLRSGKAVIEVADNGPGVQPEHRERIFEPFVTTKAIGLGTGLGLFVCRNVARALGGDVFVLERPGGGALFRVELPAVSTEQTPASAQVSSPRPPVELRAKVLIIDDDPVVLRSLADCLRASGAQIETSNDGREALKRLLEGASYDLVYCDLMMRGMTGMDLGEELALRRPELLRRVVFMTGGAFTPRAASFAEARLEAVVDKPFDIVADVAARLAQRRGA